MSPKPLLLVDIDGVLNPFLKESDPIPSGYAVHHVGGQRVLLSPAHGEWLHWLTSLFDLMWASTWEAEANTMIGPLISAPPDLPFVTFSQLNAAGWTWKVPAVQAVVGDQPVAWLDDDPGDDADDWASQRSAPTLVVRPDPTVGWTRAEFGRLTTAGFELGSDW